MSESVKYKIIKKQPHVQIKIELSPKYISTNKYEIKNEIIPSRFKKNDE